MKAAHGLLVPQQGAATPIRAKGSPGRGLKNPRGPITPKRMANAMYLMLFYNDAGAGYSSGTRNPYWMTAGIEVAGHGILWAQPEVALYDRYNHGGTSGGGYPDFIQSPKTHAIYITETQKSIARIHAVSPRLLACSFSVVPPPPHQPVNLAHAALCAGSDRTSDRTRSSSCRTPVHGADGFR